MSILFVKIISKSPIKLEMKTLSFEEMRKHRKIVLYPFQNMEQFWDHNPNKHIVIFFGTKISIGNLREEGVLHIVKHDKPFKWNFIWCQINRKGIIIIKNELT